VTSKPDFKVMVLLLVFMQLTRDLFAIAKFLLVLVLVIVIVIVNENSLLGIEALCCTLWLCLHLNYACNWYTVFVCCKLFSLCNIVHDNAT